jgi:hypothetical protein
MQGLGYKAVTNLLLFNTRWSSELLPSARFIDHSRSFKNNLLILQKKTYFSGLEILNLLTQTLKKYISYGYKNDIYRRKWCLEKKKSLVNKSIIDSILYTNSSEN